MIHHIIISLITAIMVTVTMCLSGVCFFFSLAFLISSIRDPYFINFVKSFLLLIAGACCLCMGVALVW